MIIDSKPLSMAEAKEIAEAAENEEITNFINKFVKLKEKEAKEMRKEIEDLGMLKIKDENIVKIIDLLPEDSQDVNKIFIDVSLEEDEINKILDIVKKYK